MKKPMLTIEIPCRNCKGNPHGQIKGFEKLGMFTCTTCNGSGKEFLSLTEYLKWKKKRKDLCESVVWRFNGLRVKHILIWSLIYASIGIFVSVIRGSPFGYTLAIGGGLALIPTGITFMVERIWEKK